MLHAPVSESGNKHGRLAPARPTILARASQARVADAATPFSNQVRLQTLQSAGQVLQRECACGGAPGPGRAQSPEIVPPSVHEVLRSPGQPLDAQTRVFMEACFGADFGRVRVHNDAMAAESARAVNARSYTVGRDIVFAASQYRPQTIAGRHLLAHELVHTLQQRFADASQACSLSIANPQEGFEQVAEQTALKISAQDSSLPWVLPPRPAARTPAVQRQPDPNARPDSPVTSADDEEPLLLARFDVDNRRNKAWNLDDLAMEIGIDFLVSNRAFVRVRGVYVPNPNDRDAEADARVEALHRADNVAEALYQWINPKKFSRNRYYADAVPGQPGDLDIELWLERGPVVDRPPDTPERPLASDTSAAQPPTTLPQSSVAGIKNPSPPYPGTEMDILKAFFSSPVGKPLLDLLKAAGADLWNKSSVMDKLVMLFGHLLPVSAIAGATLPGDQLSKARLWLEDSMLRPLPEKSINVGLNVDPGFLPKVLVTPLFDLKLFKDKPVDVNEKAQSNLDSFVSTYPLLPVTDGATTLFGPLIDLAEQWPLTGYLLNNKIIQTLRQCYCSDMDEAHRRTFDKFVAGDLKQAEKAFPGSRQQLRVGLYRRLIEFAGKGC